MEPTDAVLATLKDLEDKKNQIELTIWQLKTLYGLTDEDGPLPAAAGGGGGRAITPDKVPSDAFFGVGSIRDAARKYLNMVKRKQTTREIVDALEKGGFQHQSKSFFNTVYTALNRE